MIILKVILKGILKAYFRLISPLMKSRVKLAIKYKTGLRLFLFFTHVGHRIFDVLPILCIAGISRKVSQN